MPQDIENLIYVNYHIPLAKRMEKLLEAGTWDGTPAEITQEDREWLDMPPVGEEIV
jgi:hypothetical protein